MQTEYYDGREDELKSLLVDEVGPAVQEAVSDPTVRRVTIHKPGSQFSDSRGREYIVAEDGSIRRLTKKQGE